MKEFGKGMILDSTNIADFPKSANFRVLFIGPSQAYKNFPLLGETYQVVKFTKSSKDGTEYYTISNGSSTSGWHAAKLFKRTDEIRNERLSELGI